MTNLININNISNKEILEFLNSYKDVDIDYKNNIYTQALTYRLYIHLCDELNKSFRENDIKKFRDLYDEYNNYLRMLLPPSLNTTFSIYYVMLHNSFYERNEKEKQYKTYIVKNSNNNLYKIGRTKQEVSERVKQWEFLACANIDETIIIEKDIENELHKKFKDKRIKGEWFELSCGDIEFIKSKYLNYTEEDFE